jgi:hypothetical protein
MVARTSTDQSAVAHGRSLASQLIPTATPPMLEIRRRVSPAGRVRTRDRQIRGRRLKCCIPLSVERSPPLTSKTYIARPPRGTRSASPVASRKSHTWRPQAAYRYLADGSGPTVATAVLALTDFRCIER